MNRTTYYAMTAIHHENIRYKVGDKLLLTEKQALHLTLNDKITTCSRAIRVLTIFKAALSEQNRKAAEEKAFPKPKGKKDNEQNN